MSELDRLNAYLETALSDCALKSQMAAALAVNNGNMALAAMSLCAAAELARLRALAHPEHDNEGRASFDELLDVIRKDGRQFGNAALARRGINYP